MDTARPPGVALPSTEAGPSRSCENKIGTATVDGPFANLGGMLPRVRDGRSPREVETAMDSQFLIGIDLGGTKVAAAAFNLEGERLGRVARLPTMAHLKPAVTLMNLKRVVKQAKLEGGVTGTPEAIGMGSSGPLDARNRVLQDRDSLPNLVGFNIGAFSERELGAPLRLENDAACFALGEAVRGAGRGCQVVVGITLGTGFGCGITIGGRIYSGATGNAGEVARCPMGELDFDSACSGSGLVRQYRRTPGVDPEVDITARRLGDLAESGDPGAVAAWKAFGREVGTAIGTVCSVLDPSIVVLGGSVSHRLHLFRETLQQGARSVVMGAARDRFRIEASALGNAAGVTGAAELAHQQLSA